MHIIDFMNKDVFNISPLPVEARSARQQDLLKSVGGERAANLFTTVIHNPDLYETWIPFCLKLLLESAFTDIEKEVVILRTAWRTKADYEWGHHLRIGRKAGLSDAQMESLATEEPVLNDEKLDLLVDATDQYLRDHTITTETSAQLAKHFDAQQRVELPMLVGHYSLLSMLLRSLDVPFDEFAKKKERS